eukprot:sb/3476684/
MLVGFGRGFPVNRGPTDPGVVLRFNIPAGYSVPQYLTLAGLRTEVVGAPSEEKKKGVTWAPQQQEEESEVEDDTIVEKDCAARCEARVTKVTGVLGEMFCPLTQGFSKCGDYFLF